MDIYVGNLAYEATEEDLLATFEPYGVVESVSIIKDRLGRPRGFAFVKMIDREEVKTAIVGTDGRPLRGRPLRVKLAYRKKPRGEGTYW